MAAFFSRCLVCSAVDQPLVVSVASHCHALSDFSSSERIFLLPRKAACPPIEIRYREEDRGGEQKERNLAVIGMRRRVRF